MKDDPRMIRKVGTDEQTGGRCSPIAGRRLQGYGRRFRGRDQELVRQELVCSLKPVAVGLVVGDGGIDLFGCVHHEIIFGGDGFVDGLGGEE